ncbi:MAG: acetate--CoA ligase family protein [Actinomycetota bacterium]|nr:acetate--CoA ligase family protein [Actinomycetota bacterium]
MDGGVEILVGVAHGRSLPLDRGTASSSYADVAVRVIPVIYLDAREMVLSLGTFPLVDGSLGRPKGDVAALEDVTSRVSSLG